MCHNEVGLCAQIVDNVIDPMISTIERAYCTVVQR